MWSIVKNFLLFENDSKQRCRDPQENPFLVQYVLWEQQIDLIESCPLIVTFMVLI